MPIGFYTRLPFIKYKSVVYTAAVFHAKRYIYEGCPRSSWTTDVTLSFFGRFDCFLYNIHFKHIRIKNHHNYFNTSSYVSKTRFHRDRGNGYWHTGKSCPLLEVMSLLKYEIIFHFIV